MLLDVCRFHHPNTFLSYHCILTFIEILVLISWIPTSENFVSCCLSVCDTHKSKSLLLNFRCFVLQCVRISQGIMVALHILGKCNIIQRCNAYNFVFAFPSVVSSTSVDTSAKLITISNEDYKTLVNIGIWDSILFINFLFHFKEKKITKKVWC